MIKKSGIKWVVLVFLGGFINSLNASYLIVKFDKEKEQLIALDENDKNDFFKIQEIMLDYSWPTNLAKKDRLSNDHEVFKQEEAAEEKYIRKIIKKEVGDQYDIVFVPTVMYELFLLKECFEVIIKSKNIFNFKAPILGEDKDVNLFSETSLIYDNYLDGKIREIIKNKNNTMQDVFKAYRSYAEGIFPVQMKEYLNQGNTQFEKGAVSAKMNFFINNSLITFFSKEFKMTNSEVLFQQLQDTSSVVTTRILNDLIHSFNSYVVQKFPNASKDRDFFDTYGSEIFDFGILASELHIKKDALNPDGIIAKTIVAEYKARETNKALLFRGASLVSNSFDEKEVSSIINSIGFKLPKDTPKSIFNVMKLYFTNEILDYVGSYGNSLFAGSIKDKGACAYNYIVKAKNDAEKIGYLLYVDKRQYQTDQCDNLFFVAPLGSVEGIFSRGEFFHSRSKIGYTIFEKNRSDIGVFHGLDDKIGLLVINRDPMLQAALLSNYISKHALILAIKQPELEQQILKTHKEMAEMYKTIALKQETKKELKSKFEPKIEGKVKEELKSNKEEIKKTFKGADETSSEKSEIELYKKDIDECNAKIQSINDYENKKITPSEIVKILKISNYRFDSEVKGILLDIENLNKNYSQLRIKIKNLVDKEKEKCETVIRRNQEFVENRAKLYNNDEEKIRRHRQTFEEFEAQEESENCNLKIQSINDYENKKISPSEIVKSLKILNKLSFEAKDSLFNIEGKETVEVLEDRLRIKIKSLIDEEKQKCVKLVHDYEELIKLIVQFHE